MSEITAHAPNDDHVLLDVAAAAMARAVRGRQDRSPDEPGGVPGWRIEPGSPWTHVTPDDSSARAQGWKLHVSAIPLSAPVVLARAVEVLARHRCPFKFAATIDELAGLVAREQNRGSVGKFITVYPPDDDAAVRIADDLDRATRGLPGPPILSDRPYRAGGLVHYRYGVFSAPSELGNDGSYESRLTAPDGTRVPDARNAWYSPPEWAACPFPSGRAPARTTPPEAVLLADRFVIRKALRHGSKGGVFLAEDRVEGGQVVIKQARPHLGASLDGTDGRDLLRHESRMLELFGSSGVTARKVELFESGGHVFLAQECLTGTPLSAWVATNRPSRLDERWRDRVVRIARRLCDLVAAVHLHGHVFRDLTPSNVMVLDDDDCRLIDLEMTVVPGEEVGRAYTPGYAPPEQSGGPTHGPAPGTAADLYALGACLLYLTTGSPPPATRDAPAGQRDWAERLGDLVRVATAGDPIAMAFAPAVAGLMAERPHDRWDMDRLRAFLDGTVARTGVSGRGSGYRLAAPDRERLLDDGLTYVLRTVAAGVDEGRRGALWPIGGFAATADPCAVQYGTAGVMTLLAGLAGTAERPGGRAPGRREEVLAGLRQVAGWTVRRLTGEPRPSPGLYFGRAGIAWALFEAAGALRYEGLRAQALRMARELPTEWPNPDVCHGLAGAGLAQLHFWHATGDQVFAGQAAASADALVEAALSGDGEVIWEVPADFDSALAGVRHYGFAHGVAGIGAFLLASGTALGRDDHLDLAMAAGETLLAAGVRDDDAIWWTEGPGSTTRLPHWCNGSSGVGTFLVRLHVATGDHRFREAAEGAARVAHFQRFGFGTATCHGLAGDGQFLLDMADLLGEPGYRAQAEEVAASLWANAVLHDGLLLVPDESGVELTLGWNTGMTGVLDFLLRLGHGGPRPWMADAAPGNPA